MNRFHTTPRFSFFLCFSLHFPSSLTIFKIVVLWWMFPYFWGSSWPSHQILRSETSEIQAASCDCLGNWWTFSPQWKRPGFYSRIKDVSSWPSSWKNWRYCGLIWLLCMGKRVTQNHKEVLNVPMVTSRTWCEHGWTNTQQLSGL